MAYIAEGSTEVSFQPDISIPLTLTNADATVSVDVRFDVVGNACGLYRVSDGKQLWGGVILSNGASATITNALVDPNGDGSSYFVIVTDADDTRIEQVQNSLEGATSETNPTPTGRVIAVKIGSSNTGTYYSGTWHDEWMSFCRGKGMFQVRGEDELVLTVYKDGETAKAAMTFGTQYHPDGAVAAHCHLIPASNGTYNLGYSAAPLRWRRLYCTEAVDVSSDARLKRDISDLGPELIDLLRPRQYWLIDHPEKRQFGLIAQEVLEALKALGIADADLYGDENPDSLSLRYEQLFAPMIAKDQAQQRQIDALTKRLDALEKQLGGAAHGVAD